VGSPERSTHLRASPGVLAAAARPPLLLLRRRRRRDEVDARINMHRIIHRRLAGTKY
jgi:hypothetical protein